MKVQIVRLIFTGVSLGILAGCMNLGSTSSSATRFFLLETHCAAEGSPAGDIGMASRSIGLGPITLAPYLKRPQMVTRVGGNELRVDDFNQWAEPLKKNISRVVGGNLSQLTGGSHVHLFPWRRSVTIDHRISLDVNRFDADASGRVTLTAIWRIFESGGHQRRMEKRTTIIEPARSTDTADVVDAMSAALAGLSRQMARALVELTGSSPETSGPGKL